ncbi:MAG: gamma-aminobutyraldehyde dehydrogenase [Pseudonocardiales bacterium]|nr:gamma-aminobutyraldehyde dehydrogenase [Pseudonocardiales bacterium]
MHQFIDGQRRLGTGESFRVIDPSTGETVETVVLATEADVDVAVAAAAEAFPAWAAQPPSERSGALNRLATTIAGRAREFAEIESRQAGKPIRLSTEFDVPGTIDNISFFAGAARNLEGKATGEYSPDHTSSIRREAIGVIGSIAPWNYPLQMAAWKILPAIAAGNTIVLKPAEITPLTALMFAEAARDADIPDGVINIVTGTGAEAGAHLVRHPDVAMVSFTGSTAVGKQIIVAAADTVKRLHMELGGKAPFVVFDDADLEAAVHGAVAGSLINTGQDCTAATRAYVQRPLYDAFVSGVADLMGAVRLGPTLDPATDLGPLVSSRQRDHVIGMVERAAMAGAKIVRGGRAVAGPGCYYEPTLVIDAAQSSEIAQHEVFGPVLVVLPFDTDDEGIALANDTPFGLAASAWTRDVYRALRASKEIHAGAVWINDHIPIVSDMPHGGFGQSGYGKDMSQYALDEYTQIKHVMYDRTGVARKPWHRTIFANGAT